MEIQEVNGREIAQRFDRGVPAALVAELGVHSTPCTCTGFVSGYLHLADDGDDDRVTGGNTHAWVQAYVPGPGWVDFDPSSGVIGNQNLVRVAAVHELGEAIPLQGTWIGSASDHVAMKVAVKVTAAADPRPAHAIRAGMGR